MSATSQLKVASLQRVVSAESSPQDSRSGRNGSSSGSSGAEIKGSETSSNIQLRLSHSRTLSAANSLDPEGTTIDPHDLYLGDIYADADYFLTTEPEQE
jgi:hypothetical protein